MADQFIDLDFSESLEYEAQRMDWRRSLSDIHCRELASDYIRGRVDDCTTDAFREFEARWGKHIRGNGVQRKPSKKTKAKRHR